MSISSSDTDKIAQRLGEVHSVLLLASERSKDVSPEAKIHLADLLALALKVVEELQIEISKKKGSNPRPPE
jgi:hypothetical protein